MLLCRGKNEDHMGGRFFQGLQERIESSGRQHVHLIDDEHLVFPYLRRDARLLHERLDVFNGVVAGSIQFEDIIGTLLVESLATFAFVACFTIWRRILTVDSFCENPGTSRLTHASRTTEEIGMRQLPGLHGITQRRGKRGLPHNRIKSHGTVLPRRNDVIFHIFFNKSLQK